jgi:hypothetical protein
MLKPGKMKSTAYRYCTCTETHCSMAHRLPLLHLYRGALHYGAPLTIIAFVQGRSAVWGTAYRYCICTEAYCSMAHRLHLLHLYRGVLQYGAPLTVIALSFLYSGALLVLYCVALLVLQITECMK